MSSTSIAPPVAAAPPAAPEPATTYQQKVAQAKQDSFMSAIIGLTTHTRALKRVVDLSCAKEAARAQPRVAAAHDLWAQGVVLEGAEHFGRVLLTARGAGCNPMNPQAVSLENELMLVFPRPRSLHGLMLQLQWPQVGNPPKPTSLPYVFNLQARVCAPAATEAVWIDLGAVKADAYGLRTLDFNSRGVVQNVSSLRITAVKPRVGAEEDAVLRGYTLRATNLVVLEVEGQGNLVA